jgi:hypothetical protein
MAKQRRYRWRGFGEQARSRDESRKGGVGITNKQASYLAHLQRRLGLPYTGNSGMTRRDASRLIDELESQM